MHCQQKNVGLGGGLQNPARGFEPVELRHRHVEQDDIGLESQRQLNSFAPVCGFAAQFPVRMRFQQRTQAASNCGMIVGDQNATACHD